MEERVDHIYLSTAFMTCMTIVKLWSEMMVCQRNLVNVSSVRLNAFAYATTKEL